MRDLQTAVASAQDIGRRKRQEDSLIVQPPQGADPLFAVLSDGMGGHADGDLASRILVQEMFGELFVAAARLPALLDRPADVFRAALKCANNRLDEHIRAGHIGQDSGGTLVCVTVTEDRLNWLSVGDSLLYLFRDNTLTLLNEIHSMGNQLDQMVSKGLLDTESARNHPHRQCLTSAVTGSDIPKIDCPERAMDLRDGDVVLLASDGLGALPEDDIARLLRRHAAAPQEDIAQALLDAVTSVNRRNQDNTSLVIIKIEDQTEEPAGLLSRVVQRFRAMVRASLQRSSIGPTSTSNPASALTPAPARTPVLTQTGKPRP